MERTDGRGLRRVLYAIGLLGAIFLLTLVRIQPPGARSDRTAPDRFSAARALDILPLLMGGGTPHPIGSDPNAAVRNRILEQFSKMGYSPQTQIAFDCSDFGVCATVQNVLARLDGTETGPAVLLAAHYDSVPAGPGVSDDGTGVAAVLEIARALKSLPAPLHTVIFLIDDGEEAGLLGARAFVDFHPWAKEVQAAVNIDARGTSGPSLMFETGSANDWAVRLYARSVAHPATSSIAYTVYKRLPNNTDFSIFKAAGFQGLNFAIIGNQPLYHTPLDNLENVSPGSLQDQGDNGLATVEALANSGALANLDASNPPQGDAVFFDLLGFWTIHWPAGWTLLPAALATFLIAGQIGALLWTGRVDRDQFIWGLLAWLMEMISVAILAYILDRLLLLAGGLRANWLAHPAPAEIAFWMLPAAVVTLHGIILSRRAGFWGLWAGVWAWWSVLSLILAWRAPGVSYLVLVPLIVAALSGLPFTLRRNHKAGDDTLAESGVAEGDGIARQDGLAVLLPLGAAAIVGFAPALLIYDALGTGAIVGVAALIGLILTSVTPLCTDLRAARGLLAAAFPAVPILAVGLASFAAVAVPAYSARSPEHLNIEYWQDADAESAQWVVESDSGRLPEPLRRAASFSRVASGPFPWNRGPKFVVSAPNLNLAPPTFTLLEDSQTDSRRFYHALLRSERAAPEAMLLFPPGSQVDDVRVGGVALRPQTALAQSAFNGWSVYACAAMPAEGVEVSFSLPVGRPVEISAVDRTYGLPLDGQFLLKARPPNASPANTGDVTVVTRRVRLFP